MSGLKKRIDALSKILTDDVGSQIIIKSGDIILANTKSEKVCSKLIRIVVNV